MLTLVGKKKLSRLDGGQVGGVFHSHVLYIHVPTSLRMQPWTVLHGNSSCYCYSMVLAHDLLTGSVTNRYYYCVQTHMKEIANFPS